MELTVWLAFVMASTIVILIPGPTVIFIMGLAINQGRQFVLPAALGVAFGDLIAMSVSIAGLGALLLSSALLFQIVKWGGALYLLYLGYRLFKSASSLSPALSTEQHKPEQHLRARHLTSQHLTTGQSFKAAALITALNPKSIAFFISFVPQFIDVSRELLLSPALQALILIATFVFLGFINALLYGFLTDNLHQRMTTPLIARWLTRLSGGILMGLGLTMALYKKTAQ